MRRSRGILSLLTTLCATALAGCPMGAAHSRQDPSTLSPCPGSTLAVSEGYFESRNPEAVRDTLMGFGFLHPDAEPTFVEWTARPRLLNRAHYARGLEQAYPPDLKNRGMGGTTVFLLVLGPEGNVQRIAVRESSGHLALDHAGAVALQQARFRPAMHDACRTAALIQMPITFSVQ